MTSSSADGLVPLDITLNLNLVFPHFTRLRRQLMCLQYLVNNDPLKKLKSVINICYAVFRSAGSAVTSQPPFLWSNWTLKRLYISNGLRSFCVNKLIPLSTYISIRICIGIYCICAVCLECSRSAFDIRANF